MKLVKSLLLGSAVGLIGAVSAQAADLPTRKSAPVEYVRICDAYGAGFFYIPGTDTCLKVGGLALFEARAFGPNYSSVSIGNASGGGNVKTGANVRQAAARDAYGTAVLGRLELDARTQTGYGTLRAFVRVDASAGSASTSSTGSPGAGIAGLGNAGNNGGQAPLTAKEFTYVNKAFIQFAGLTAGRAQSMFDFYADAYNYEALRGSDATTNLLAYTATFGGGFSATISVEDEVYRRNSIGTVLGAGSFAAGSPLNVGHFADTGGTRIPDIVANIRVDQPWGAIQLSGAAHQIHAQDLLGTAAAPVLVGVAGGGVGGTSLESEVKKYGFAVQAGLMFNLPMFAPGDTLWLQAAYEQGASGYIDGANLAFVQGGDFTRNYGIGIARIPGALGWSGADQDCVFTAAGRCDEQHGFAVVGAFKHYWIPTLSSALYGSYMQENYSAAALAGSPGVLGANNYHEFRVGTNLVWTPVKGFDIGGELMYIGVSQTTPGQLVNNTGVPFQNKLGELEGRIRVQRAF